MLYPPSNVVPAQAGARGIPFSCSPAALALAQRRQLDRGADHHACRTAQTVPMWGYSCGMRDTQPAATAAAREP